jgi:hypothetical protein
MDNGIWEMGYQLNRFLSISLYAIWHSIHPSMTPGNRLTIQYEVLKSKIPNLKYAEAAGKLFSKEHVKA